MKSAWRFLILLLMVVTPAVTLGQTDCDTCTVNLHQIADNLYLDTSLIPAGYDNAMIIRLYDFLVANVEPNCRTPFPGYCGQLPIIIRYTPYTVEGHYPVTTEGFAGWCDVVVAECEAGMPGTCLLRLPAKDDKYESLAFLTLIALPDSDDPDYIEQLWGITTHELAHTLGAIDGPRFMLYEPDNLLDPIDYTSDTYYWFGIQSLFERGWQGVVWDAWQDQCRDEICGKLRSDVFLLEDGVIAN